MLYPTAYALNAIILTLISGVVIFCIANIYQRPVAMFLIGCFIFGLTIRFFLKVAHGL